MIATGVVVWQSDAVFDALRAEAKEWLWRAQSDFSEDDSAARAIWRGIAARGWRRHVGLDSASANMLLTLAVVNMLEIECRKRSGRIPRGKDLLATIEELDPQLLGRSRNRSLPPRATSKGGMRRVDRRSNDRGARILCVGLGAGTVSRAARGNEKWQERTRVRSCRTSVARTTASSLSAEECR